MVYWLIILFGGGELRHSWTMVQMLKSMVKFVIVMVVMTVIFSLIWGEIITDRLYNCTDPVGCDYLHPGDWIHGQVVFVNHVVISPSMGGPDTIKEGWSVSRLWALWLSFFIVSLGFSFFLARGVWIPRSKAPSKPLQATATAPGS